jgi:hypothetical protein
MFPWYARIRLRYSCCSNKSTTFTRFVVPEMKRKGDIELHSTTANFQVRLDDLEVYSVDFAPKKKHAIDLSYTDFRGLRSEVVVEASLHIAANMLRCRKVASLWTSHSGSSLAPCHPKCTPASTISYLTFLVRPSWFSLPQRLISSNILPVTLHHFARKSHDTRCQSRLRSASSAPFKSRSNSATSKCFGIASVGFVLQTSCARCHNALYYCGKNCQVLHWKTYKKD